MLSNTQNESYYTFQDDHIKHQSNANQSQPAILAKLNTIQSLLTKTLTVTISNQKHLQNLSNRINQLQQQLNTVKISKIPSKDVYNQPSMRNSVNSNLNTKKKSKSYHKTLISTIKQKEKLIDSQISILLNKNPQTSKNKAPLSFFLANSILK